MIEISIWKIFLVLLVALMVLGPKQLPKAAQILGRLLAQLRGTLNTVQREIHEIQSDPKKEMSEKESDK